MIDWSRVIELRDEVGAEDLEEVVELFLEEVEATLSDLSPDADAKTLAEQMHFLKGSSLNLGFSDLAQICADGERNAGDGNCGAINLEDVQTCYAQSKTTFLANLSDQIAA